MSRVDELNEKFAVPGIVRAVLGKGSLPTIAITSALASAEIYLHGAHVTHFQPRGAAPVLFLSHLSHYEDGKPIRGGVPLIFPWFGPKADMPTAPMHGLVRTREWNVESCDMRSDGTVRIVLDCASDSETVSRWQHQFKLRFTIIVGTHLEMTLEVRNTSSASFTFEEALHTYLAVADARNIQIDGLENVQYIDKPDGGKIKTQSTGQIRLTGQTDRVYFNTASTVLVRDPGLNRNLRIEKEHSNTTVVWNPWIETVRSIADLGDEEWLQMVCVETANAKQNMVLLAAGASHRMTARIAIVP